MYGAMLTAWAAAGVAGPLLVASLKDNYPDRAVIYCFLIGRAVSGDRFRVLRSWSRNEKCTPGKPALDDLGIPAAYLQRP